MTLAADLNIEHPEYTEAYPVLSLIADLRAGASVMAKTPARYIVRRYGETPEEYQSRLAKFCYTPIMSDAIRTFVSKLSSAPVAVSGTNAEWWQNWTTRMDGKAMSEAKLLTAVFSTLLYYRRVWVLVDKPRLAPARSRYEQGNVLPFVRVLDPLTVINWGDGWIKTKQVITTTQARGKSTVKTRWTIYDDTTITVYEQAPGKDATQVDTLAHGYKSVPFRYAEIATELHTAGSAYLKQLQHTAIENSWTDSGTIAGSVQRLYVPVPASPANDPRVVYDEPDYSTLQTGNSRVLIGGDYKVIETTGAAVATLSAQLDKIEHQVRQLSSLGYLSGSSKGALEQSGLSKIADMSSLQDAMLAYGSVVRPLYEAVLNLVAIAAGSNDKPRVTGLDSYEIDNLDSALEQLEPLAKHATMLPPTALKLWLGKLANLMTGEVSQDIQNAINAELEQASAIVISDTDGDQTRKLRKPRKPRTSVPNA